MADKDKKDKIKEGMDFIKSQLDQELQVIYEHNPFLALLAQILINGKKK